MAFTKRTFSSFAAIAMLVVHFLHACLAQQTNQQNLATDESALVALKAHITSDPNGILAGNWSTATSSCNWIGVTCSSRHIRVIALNMSSMNLAGTIPPQMGNLTFLTSLDLGNNNFSGELPQELANLDRLRLLNLNFNNFKGELPSWFGLLQNLQILLLRNNSFTGFIPFSDLSNMANLGILDLSYNSLQGQIPEEIANLQKLRVLTIQNSQLTGPIPATMFNISTLEIIDLSGNKLSGEIPQEIGNLQNLQTLRLTKNQFSGPIPGTLFNISTLQVLHLSNNNLTGSLPANMCDHLPNLQRLNLDFNWLEGEIPKQIYRCSALQILSLSENKLSGSIPREIGNLTMLTGFDFNSNKLSGEIPAEIINLDKLEVLSLSINSLTGDLPAGIFNMSRLVLIGLTANYLSGTLPSDLGSRLPNLETFYINMNNLTGTISSSISNCSNLAEFVISTNKFFGEIPNSLGNLPLLQRVHIFQNEFTSESSDTGVSFITSMTSCRNLRQLWIGENPITGNLPISIGNFSTSLQSFTSDHCKLRGNIPSQVGNLSNLVWLYLSENNLTGEIPSTLESIQGMQELYLAGNKLEGSIPQSLCSLPYISTLYLERNKLSGRIPECLSNVTAMRRLVLGYNRLTSSVPASLWTLKDLLLLNLNSNFLSGSLPPDIGNLKSATYISLSRNQLTGNIPGEVGGLKVLTELILDNNRLEGSIPESIGSMISLEWVELSHNNLSGFIPKSLDALRYLFYFNVSYNHLIGEIPSNGSFQNFTAESFMFNEGLCGAPRFHVQPCKIRVTSTSHKSRTKKLDPIGFILAGVAALVLTVMLIFVYLRYRKGQAVKPDTGPPSLNILARVSYYELLRATEGYSESNLLGTGSSGSVYKGVLQDGTILAVKVFNLEQDAALKSFDTECEVLRRLRHRNLTKVISSCSNYDFKALVLEYMPNGSLEMWLYSSDSSLDIVQRLDIAIDVACALEYLHHDHITPIAHCDLKPSNILLDENMIAHVSDFGIAKLLSDETKAFTETLGTLGYVAPEYGLEGLTSIRCDVYSFGIVLLETFTRKNPNDERFVGEFSLRRWVEGSLTTEVLQIFDATLLRPEDTHFTEKLHCLISVMDLALKCCAESPAERKNMRDAVTELKKIKLKLLAGLPGN